MANAEQSASKPTGRRSLLPWLGTPLAACALLWTAAYNRYPTVFPDTGGYLSRVAFHEPLFPYRSLAYAAFISLASFGVSAWLIVVAQSLLTASVIYLVFDYLTREGDVRVPKTALFAVLILFLAVATGLPWYVSEIMPDMFTALLFLSLFLLLYDADLSAGKRIFLSVVFGLSLAAHLSHIPIVVLLLAGLIVIRAMPPLRVLWWPASARRVIVSVLGPALIACLTLCVLNQSVGLGFTLAPAQDAFLFGRLLRSGLAARYLEERCTTQAVAACRDLGHLPRTEDDFMWNPNALAVDLGIRDAGGTSAETKTMVRGILLDHPLAFAADCARQAVLQFVSMGPGNDWSPYHAGFIANAVRARFPREWNQYIQSAQWSGRLLDVSDKMGAWYIAVFWTSLAGSIFLAFAVRSASRVHQFFGAALLLLICNALGTGPLSEVSGRYQGRVAWLMPFCFVFYAAALVAEWRKPPQHGESGTERAAA